MIEGGKASDRKPTGSCGHPDGEKSKKEFRDGEGKVGSGRGGAIDPAPWAGGGEHGERNGEGPSKEERGKGEKDGGGSTLGD